jgi:hypothetical protein
MILNQSVDTFQRMNIGFPVCGIRIVLLRVELRHLIAACRLRDWEDLLPGTTPVVRLPRGRLSETIGVPVAALLRWDTFIPTTAAAPVAARIPETYPIVRSAFGAFSDTASDWLELRGRRLSDVNL